MKLPLFTLADDKSRGPGLVPAARVTAGIELQGCSLAKKIACAGALAACAVACAGTAGVACASCFAGLGMSSCMDCL